MRCSMIFVVHAARPGIRCCTVDARRTFTASDLGKQQHRARGIASLIGLALAQRRIQKTLCAIECSAHQRRAHQQHHGQAGQVLHQSAQRGKWRGHRRSVMKKLRPGCDALSQRQPSSAQLSVGALQGNEGAPWTSAALTDGSTAACIASTCSASARCAKHSASFH